MKISSIVSVIYLFFILCSPAAAHFGMVIPSTNSADKSTRELKLQLSFSHPFEMVGMDLAKPERFFVFNGSRSVSLLEDITPAEIMEHKGWMTEYTIKRPGVYHFVMEPKPYWEPSEDIHIIHYTKTVVAAFGMENGWDKAIGLPIEITPLLRPFGNYAGNTFTGKILQNGKPVPFSEVEVEYYNRENKFASPTDYHITQVVKSDANGVFSFTCPWGGWWGFSALVEADYTMKDPEGNDKSVEIGGVLWLYFDDPSTK